MANLKASPDESGEQDINGSYYLRIERIKLLNGALFCFLKCLMFNH